MVSYPAINLVDIVIDEVALEGLDGITLEALWQRLSMRLHDPLPLPKSFMEQAWSICLEVKGLSFYRLESPRSNLIMFDRYEFIDPDLGTILEPDDVPEDIYPHTPIEDAVNGIKGSCSSYHSRVDISSKVRTLSVHEATDSYGQSLVIVASQSIREYALMGDNVCPTLDLTVIQYCFLERVGRARYHGEVTQGRMSLSLLKEGPKSLFYHRKYLLGHKLITKQIHHQKTAGHSCSGSLLHLPRFYVERKPKVIYIAEQVIEILKSKVNCVAEYDEIKKELQIENSIKKLFKTAFFQKVVKTDLRVPYRTLYPKAEGKEWQQKNNIKKEKTIRVVQLLDPNIDISELWSREEVNDDDEPFELDISEQKFNVPILKQANRMVEASGRQGLCQGELAKKMGQTKLQARTILRNLVKTNIVATYMNDMGRQRVTKYVSKKYEKSSTMSKQFEKEMHKIKQLTKKVDVKMVSEEAAPMSSQEVIASGPQGSSAIKDVQGTANTLANEVKIETVHRTEQVVLKENHSEDPEALGSQANENCSRLQEPISKNNTFPAVNKILFKYNLTKQRHKYKCTFLNLSQMRSSSLESVDSRSKTLQQTVTSLMTHSPGSVRSSGDNRTTEQILEEQSKKMPTLNMVDRAKAISFYDSIEAKLVEQQPVLLGKPPTEVIGFMEDLYINEKKPVSSITYRLLRRASMIIESVMEHKVIDDITKLMKMINEEEDREGYDVKIDKKSLIRLLQKLAKDNLVKNIKLTLRANDKEKSLTFICDPTIGIGHTVIQSAVEQAKIKFCLLGSQKVQAIIENKPEQGDKADKDSLAAPTTKKMKSAIANLEYDFKAGKRYGYSPKFVRMQTLHTFLFYLIYDHPGEQTASKEQQIESLRKNGFLIDSELEEEMSMVYNTEIGWKMFIPPLTRHSGWPLGWTIMCDVLLRIPLSVFIKIHNVPFIIPNLEAYLNHPIKKHILVKNLPSQIRNTLLFGRKYIFNIHESVTRLCYIGLIQFGPQKLKEKDQVFIYLNRRTELMDTISSAAGYHKIEDKEYPRISYVFESLQVVEKYWYDMWNTCINTFLGGRLVVQGQDILLEDLGKKADMLKAVKARNPEEAVLMDNGFVPGDRKGAAGVDSAFFAHLKRNWNWGASHYSHQHKYNKGDEKKKVEQQERSAYLSKIKAKPLKFTEFAGLKKVTGPATVNATELRKKINQRHKNVEERRTKQQKYQKLVSHHTVKPKSFIRTVLPRKRKLRPRVKYDEVDFCALQQMDKLRVDWEPHEDNILLMCKVAMMYLCPNPRKQLITFIAVRDVLHTYSASSHNKTSRACQRRLLYMFRKPQTVKSVALGLEEIKQNFYINKRFGGVVEKMKKECQDPYEYEEQVAKMFKELVAYIAKKYYNITDIEPRESVVVPKTIQEFNLLYKLKHPMKHSTNGFTKDIRNITDIHSATINSVIHSSMCCGKDRTSWAYQLFRVYQQYPESLLRAAMTKIRSDQMVSVKKSYMCAIKKYGNCMPMSSPQYQLSTGYIYKFQTKWPYEVFNESYHLLHKLAQWQSENQREDSNYRVPGTVDGIEAGPVTGGLVAGIHDYLTRGQLDFDIEIPDQIIMLDPRLKEKDETYLRIAQRYQDILMSLDHMNLKKKKSKGTNLIDPEVDEEDEIERREFEDKIIKEKREKEDRDRWNYWKSRNDEVGRRLEESEMKQVREAEDKERRRKREKFDSEMAVRKQKYLQVLELGEENVPEAIVSEFRTPEEEKEDAELDESDSEQEENDVDDDEDNHTIRFQDGTTITLSREDIEGSSSDLEDDDQEKIDSESSEIKSNKDVERPSRKKIFSDASCESPAPKKTKADDSLPGASPKTSSDAPARVFPKIHKKQPKRLHDQLQDSIICAKLSDENDTNLSDETSSLDLSGSTEGDSSSSPISPLDGKTARMGFYEDLERNELDTPMVPIEGTIKLVPQSQSENQRSLSNDSDSSIKRKGIDSDDEESLGELIVKRARMESDGNSFDETMIDDPSKRVVPRDGSSDRIENSKDDLEAEATGRGNKNMQEIEMRIESKNDRKEDDRSVPKSRGTDELSTKSNLDSPSLTYSRVNEMIRNMHYETGGERPDSKTDDMNDMQKRCTRIALLMMREELNDLALSDSHHAHDYFVVNTFRIYYSLRLPESKGPRRLETFQGFEVPTDMLPLKVDLARELLDDLKRFAVFPKDHISYMDFKKVVAGRVGIAWDDIEAVYKFVQDKKEIGATLKQLVTKFNAMSKDYLHSVLSLLVEHRFFLRSGVTTVHYIHQHHIDPWLIHSYKILRLDKEAHTPLPSGSMYFMEGNEDESMQQTTRKALECNAMEYNLESSPSKALESNAMEDNLESSSSKALENSAMEDNLESSTSKALESSAKDDDKFLEASGISNEAAKLATIDDKQLERNQQQNNCESTISDAVTEDTSCSMLRSVLTDAKPREKFIDKRRDIKDSIDNEEVNSSSMGRRLHRKRTALLQQKDIQRAAKKLDFNTAEAIKVVVKPWIRIDGVLNRRVLDRMLGAVLAYCIMHPGATLAKVQRRFMPALQPFHSRELVEMLGKLECLEMKAFKKPKITLFSKPASVTLESTTGLESEEELILEPVIDASVKFGMFLGNKMYTADFLS